MSAAEQLALRAAEATPAPLLRRMRGLSDRAIAWLFIAPTMLLLLASLAQLLRALECVLDRHCGVKPW